MLINDTSLKVFNLHDLNFLSKLFSNKYKLDEDFYRELLPIVEAELPSYTPDNNFNLGLSEKTLQNGHY